MKTRIYYPGKIELGEPMHLPKEQSHHLATVLRATAGESLILFNGQGGEYECDIESIRKNAVIVNLRNYVNINRESPLPIILAQGISRGERMDYTVQKATELGVTEIQPMFTEYGTKLPEDRAEKKIAHWQAIAISAAEQSGRTAIPLIKPPLPFREVLKLKGTLMIGDTEASEPIKALTPPNPPVILLIGPEGGFADHEIAAATQAGAKRISLGPRILRTETAGMIAIALLQNAFGDF
jgi:16S rRNA (uracil1498-N3)-methyltransferase